MPRVLGFQAEFPDIEVRLVTTRGHDGLRLDFEQVDLAVWYGSGRWPDVACERLMSEQLVPVCSPGLLAGEQALASPADLRDATLIHVLMRIGQWRNWLEAAGVEGVDPARAPARPAAGQVLKRLYQPGRPEGGMPTVWRWHPDFRRPFSSRWCAHRRARARR